MMILKKRKQLTLDEVVDMVLAYQEFYSNYPLKELEERSFISENQPDKIRKRLGKQ